MALYLIDNVRSDRLRLLVDAELMTEEMRTIEEETKATIGASETVVIDSNTGLGGWSTVSVEVYNEEEMEMMRQQLALKETEEECVKADLSLKRAMEFAEDDNDNVILFIK